MLLSRLTYARYFVADDDCRHYLTPLRLFYIIIRFFIRVEPLERSPCLPLLAMPQRRRRFVTRSAMPRLDICLFYIRYAGYSAMMMLMLRCHPASYLDAISQCRCIITARLRITLLRHERLRDTPLLEYYHCTSLYLLIRERYASRYINRHYVIVTLLHVVEGHEPAAVTALITLILPHITLLEHYAAATLAAPFTPPHDRPLLSHTPLLLRHAAATLLPAIDA